jgi:hypothetical protein
VYLYENLTAYGLVVNKNVGGGDLNFNGGVSVKQEERQYSTQMSKLPSSVIRRR